MSTFGKRGGDGGTPTQYSRADSFVRGKCIVLRSEKPLQFFDSCMAALRRLEPF